MNAAPRTATMDEIRTAYVIRRMEQAEELNEKITPASVFHDEFERGFNEAVERAVRARTADLEADLEELRADRDRYRREASWRQFREGCLEAALERSKPVHVRHVMTESGHRTLCGAPPDTGRPAPGDTVRLCEPCRRVAFRMDSGQPGAAPSGTLDGVPSFTVDVVITSQTTGNVMTIRAGSFAPEPRVVGTRGTLNVVADRPATGRALAAVLRRFIEQVEAWR